MATEDSKDFWTTHPFSDDLAAEFEKFVDLVNDAFAVHAVEDEDFEVHVEGGARCDAQLIIRNYRALSLATVREVAIRLREELGKFPHYWRLQIFVFRPGKQFGQDETVLWLDIDRYGISQYCGQVKSEEFPNIEEFTKHYWGT